MKSGIFILATLITQAYSQKDLFASLVHLEDAFQNEVKLISHLESFVNGLEENIQLVKEKLNEAKRHRTSVKDVAKYLQNPLNSFHYLKSADEFLSFISGYVTDPVLELLEYFEEIENSVGWPTHEDAVGAALALLRLQTTYKLDTDQLIEGKIFKYISAPLTVADCVIIGEAAFTNSRELSKEWMEKANEKCSDEDCDPVLRLKIAEHLAYILFDNGNLSQSLDMTERLLELEPNHERAVTNKQYLLEEINNIPPSQRSGNFMKDPQGKHDSDKHYHYSCQGSIQPPKEITNKLKCRYVHHNNPYLMLGPVKQEEAYLDPKIVIYRDLLTDSEMQELKALSKRDLGRSRIQGGISDEIRLSKVAWLSSENSTIARKVCERFAAYSDLYLPTAEPLQVANYGLGGHYIPHLDAYNEEDAVEVWTEGNRIATLLVYLNEVGEGGATVFPKLGVYVQPEKGSAVVWHNLFRNGSLDNRTQHAACPVLFGTKWAANLWFHEAGHEFSKPCLLNRFDT